MQASQTGLEYIFDRLFWFQLSSNGSTAVCYEGERGGGGGGGGSKRRLAFQTNLKLVLSCVVNLSTA